MKQRTTLEATNLLPLTRPHIRRRLLGALRPEGALIPLELSLTDVVADLDPGMIDWPSTINWSLAPDRDLGRAPDQRRP